MRLSDIFQLFAALLSGGINGLRAKLDELPSNIPTSCSKPTSISQFDHETRWYLIAIIGMICINALALFYVPKMLESSASRQLIAKRIKASQLKHPLMDHRTLTYSNQFRAVDVEPVPINLHQTRKRVKVPYFLPKGFKTKVRISVLVDEDGKYVRHIALAHPYPSLRRAVEKRLPELNFLPALRRGKPVPFWTEVVFYFER